MAQSREERLARKKAYHEAHREEERAYREAYHGAHREEGKAYSKALREGNEELLEAAGYNIKTCKICGYNRCIASIDAHHLNPDEKEAGIGNMMVRCASVEAKYRLLEEAAKCIFVCANCHREIHAGLIKIEVEA